MTIPRYYEFQNPVKINAGEDALRTLPAELKRLQAARPAVITDKGVSNAGLLDHVLNGFKNSDITIGLVFDETPSDSSVTVVNRIADLFIENNCDSIIAVGGGSAIDTAKAVNIVVSENEKDLRKFVGADRLSARPKPLIVVPTTAGTGSEVTLVAVISDTEKGVKLPFTSRLLLPSVAVLDPKMTISLPPRLTATTGMDALTHAVEAYTCLQKNPMSDAFAWSAISLISNNLEKAVSSGQDTSARFAMANASLMAGVAFSNSMVGAVHAIGHACGAVAHVHHGNAMAILLPYVMKFNLDTIGHLYAELLLPLAGAEIYANTKPTLRARKFIEEVLLLNYRLSKLCAMPVKLNQAGVKRADFKKIAEMAVNDGAMLPNPKDLSESDVLSILNEAY